MSSVRMCDRCSNVFSELEDGWQTFQATTQKTDEDGRRVSISVAMDACPSCSIAGPKALQKSAQETQEQRDLDARIAALEKETGVGNH